MSGVEAAAPMAHFQASKFTAGHDPARQVIYSDLSRKRGPTPLPDSFYEAVARTAARDPKKPVKSVLESGITTRGGKPSRRTVQNWLRESERRGFLSAIQKLNPDPV